MYTQKDEEPIPLISDSIPLYGSDDLTQREGEIKKITGIIDVGTLIAADPGIDVATPEDLVLIFNFTSLPRLVSTLSPQNPNDIKDDGTMAWLDFEGSQITYCQDRPPESGFALFSPLLTRVRPSVQITFGSPSGRFHAVEFYLSLNAGWGSATEPVSNATCRFEIKTSGVAMPEQISFVNVPKGASRQIRQIVDSSGFTIKITQFEIFPGESGSGSQPNWIFRMARIWEIQ
jgi:hypothetical protein